MIKQITAKTLLSSSKKPDPWFGIKYTMNLYRGCQHQCIYCDSRSECYRIENFAEIHVKTNALDLLRRELARKRVKGTIGTGSMNDPYMQVEAEWNMTGRALAIIAERGFPVHIITKSNLVLRDVETLREINRVYAAVSFTITTTDDALCRKIEPGASLASQRFAAMRALADDGIYTGVTMMPILPFLEDNAENILAIVERARDAGAGYIIAAFGMTMRDRQRAYFYDKLDHLFPGVRAQYERRYGERYSCPVPNAARLEKIFRERCAQLGIATRMHPYQPETQLRFTTI
ncbi:MAG: radical SAM protein [Chloroflexi bacterium]|nr:radical SAM protein [Chloroflexota bacterium]